MTTQTTRGAISTSHHLATAAGVAALEAGGNAIDAAIAAAAALCVVYPNNVALGGDLVALVRSPEGEVRFLNASGTAPHHQTREALAEKHGHSLPIRGIDTVTVPGGVRGWQALHELGATRTWAQHLEAATRYAGDGVPMSRSVARAIITDREALESDAGCAGVFFPDGVPIAEGEPFVQPELHATLTQMALHGPDEFYTGKLAKQWISGLQALGSTITESDVSAYVPEWAEPLEGSYGGYRVLTGPPNTSGFALLRALNAIAGVGANSGKAPITDPLQGGAGALATAFQEANAVRAAALADPDYGCTGAELVEMVAPEHPLPGQGKANGDTVGLSAISADGWSISLINSVFWAFGAAILEPSTGILFQNRGTSFSLDPTSPNAFAGGKRPRHTLMPVLVMRDQDVVWVPSTMGGAAQPQIHTQLLLQVLDGADPREATHAPRWIVEEPAADGSVRITVESDVPLSTQQSLKNAGFILNIVPPFTETLGHSNLIEVTSEGYTASSDPRSDGSAAIVTL